LGNKGGAAPLKNSNSLGNKGGAALGNTCSSSNEKKVNTLFTRGMDLERYGDNIEAMSKFREVIELDPKHGNANYSLARLQNIRFINGDFVASGEYSQIIGHYEAAHRGGCKEAMHSMRKLQFHGDHRKEGVCIPSDKDCVALVEHFKTHAAEAQAESDASPGQADLLAASSKAHIMFSEVVVVCSDPTTLPAAFIIAEGEMRLSVEQDPSSFTKHAYLANVLCERNMIHSGMVWFKKALKINPNYLDAIDALKYLEGLGHMGRESWDFGLDDPRNDDPVWRYFNTFEAPIPVKPYAARKEESELSDDDQWSDEESGGDQMSDEEGGDDQVL
jgi:tetratricopeptide (TPR) repeat protein